MQCRQIVGKTWGITPSMMKWIYTAVICQLCRMHVCSGLAVSTKVSSEETHKGAETCLPDDFISFSCTSTGAPELLLNIIPILRNFYWLRQCEGHTESLLVALACQPNWFLWENKKPC